MGGEQADWAGWGVRRALRVPLGVLVAQVCPEVYPTTHLQYTHFSTCTYFSKVVIVFSFKDPPTQKQWEIIM